MFIINKKELNFLILYQDLLVFHVACSKVLYENMGSVLFLCIYQSPFKKSPAVGPFNETETEIWAGWSLKS